MCIVYGMQLSRWKLTVQTPVNGRADPPVPLFRAVH